jgi:cell division protein FtsB
VRGKRGPSRDAGRQEPRRSAGGHLTGRAAILALVMCAIALTLAYPVREYVAQRQEIAGLRHQERLARQHVERLQQHQKRLADESYIKQEARRRLHYCMPGEKCFVVLDGDGGGDHPQQSGPRRRPPWYETLWRSVETADGR